MRIPKNLKPVLEYAAQNGWTITRRTERATLIFEKKDRQQVSVSMRTGDPRAINNMLSTFRRADRFAENRMQPTT